jgi:hypothetical protein
MQVAEIVARFIFIPNVVNEVLKFYTQEVSWVVYNSFWVLSPAAERAAWN